MGRKWLRGLQFLRLRNALHTLEIFSSMMGKKWLRGLQFLRLRNALHTLKLSPQNWLIWRIACLETSKSQGTKRVGQPFNSERYLFIPFLKNSLMSQTKNRSSEKSHKKDHMTYNWHNIVLRAIKNNKVSGGKLKIWKFSANFVLETQYRSFQKQQQNLDQATFCSSLYRILIFNLKIKQRKIETSTRISYASFCRKNYSKLNSHSISALHEQKIFQLGK